MIAYFGVEGDIHWGSVAAWAGVTARFAMTAVAVLVALGLFESLRGPRIRITFKNMQPWCRRVALADGGEVLWVRVGVENTGRRPARGCVGRLIGVKTDRILRED